MFKLFNKKAKITEVDATSLGDSLGKSILLSWCSKSTIEAFKLKFNLKDIDTVEEEYFYLIMFLATYSCQIAFVENKEIANVILDNFHKYVKEKKSKLPLEITKAREKEEELKNRYAQYYALSRTEEHNIDIGFLISQIPYNFFASILRKDLKYIFNDKDFRKQWGLYTLELSSWIGEVLKDFTDIMINIRKKYKIED